MTRLLILSCGARKRPDVSPLPAIERYDGPRYRTMRNLFAAGIPRPEILILSAEFGLIDGKVLIPDYDRVLDANRGRALIPQIAPVLADAATRHAEAFVVAGAEYVRALRAACPLGLTLIVPPGGSGKKLQALKRWIKEGA